MSEPNRSKIQSIIRFGSRARGDDTSISDDDVLVFAGEIDDPVALFQEVDRLLPTDPQLRDLDLHTYSPQISPQLAYEILRDAKVLYETAPGQAALDLAELALHAEPPAPPLQNFLQVNRMGREETLRKIERRLVSLERKLTGLTAHLETTSEVEYLKDELIQEFAFARMYKITQDVIDLAALLIALEGRIAPAAGPERLEVLGEMGLIPTALAARLVSMARFRNVLAHTYEMLDWSRLYHFAKVESKDVEAFSAAVKAYLAGENR